MFLMGPIKQLFKMFEKGRSVATLIYFAAMFATLFSAIRASHLIDVHMFLWNLLSFSH